MSFKNAFKLLITRFKNVWALLLYIIILAIVLLSVGSFFLIPMTRSLSEAGIGESFNAAMQGLMNGASISETTAALGEVLRGVRAALKNDTGLFVNTTLFLVLIMTVGYRFLLGLYELPLVSVIQGAMSDNADYGFASKYLSWFTRSVRFSLVKMLVMTAYDCIAVALVIGFASLGKLIGALVAPFFFMLALLVTLALRFTVISGWSPAVVVGGKKIFPALGASVRHAFRNFGSVFSVFLMAWIVLIVINFMIALFTFFVGLLFTIPMSMYFIQLLNMTSYYGKNGKSYYLDGAIYDPKTPAAADKQNRS